MLNTSKISSYFYYKWRRSLKYQFTYFTIFISSLFSGFQLFSSRLNFDPNMYIVPGKFDQLYTWAGLSLICVAVFAMCSFLSSQLSNALPLFYRFGTTKDLKSAVHFLNCKDDDKVKVPVAGGVYILACTECAVHMKTLVSLTQKTLEYQEAIDISKTLIRESL